MECTAHYWDIGSSSEGIALAHCYRCPAWQYQAVDPTRENIEKANKLNEEQGFPLVAISKSALKALDNPDPIGEDEGIVPETSPEKIKGANMTMTEVPQKPVGHNIKAIHKFYEANRESILKDLKTLGKDATLTRWKMSRNAFNHLIASSGIVVTGKRHYNKQNRLTKSFSEREKDKEVMIEDYNNMPLMDFYKKHHISSNLWARLKKEWGIKGKNARKTVSSETNDPVIGIKRPAGPIFTLPGWNEAWGDLVKVEWLKTVATLAANWGWK
jgi:hypothetical protein